jgi:hypothetical protein
MRRMPSTKAIVAALLGGQLTGYDSRCPAFFVGAFFAR